MVTQGENVHARWEMIMQGGCKVKMPMRGGKWSHKVRMSTQGGKWSCKMDAR